jgi:putative Ca2+/H+ antiporter (TMEM165/GDT1 family)
MTALFAALGVVFIAELGDKTQLVALGFGARHKLGPVLAGVALAYMATNLLSVVIGGLLGTALPTDAIGIGGGILFLAFAAWNLRPEPEEPEVEPGVEPAVRSSARVVLSVGTAMFVAELGDKTMLATATLAARGNPVLVWIGATIGIFLAGALGVLLGRALGTRLPERVTRIGSSIMFAVFGVVLIAVSV